jgi:hypothetical protein
VVPLATLQYNDWDEQDGENGDNDENGDSTVERDVKKCLRKLKDMITYRVSSMCYV